jgi:hypothetical protein
MIYLCLLIRFLLHHFRPRPTSSGSISDLFYYLYFAFWMLPFTTRNKSVVSPVLSQPLAALLLGRILMELIEIDPSVE